MRRLRIALLADIHGNLPALEAVVADIGHRGADHVVNLGDSLSGPLLPQETAHFLRARDWLQLAGNHERQLLTLPPGKRGPSDQFTFARLTGTELDWLRSLPATARLAPQVFLCHGSPRSDAEYFLETVENGGVRLATPDELESRRSGETSELIACGHSHVARTVRTAHGQWIVNPGSVGLPAFDDTAPEPHVVENGSPDARYAIVEDGPGGWRTELISVPYDHHAMAALATRHGRPDWASALLSGYL